MPFRSFTRTAASCGSLAREKAELCKSHGKSGRLFGLSHRSWRGTAKDDTMFLKLMHDLILVYTMIRHFYNLRKRAQRCLNLANTSSDLEVVEQLRVWSVEIADEADAAERRTAENRKGAEVNYGPFP